MDKDVNKLLKTLEFEIDKKCMELKNKKNTKNKQILYVLLLSLFATIPSLLIIINISIIYFVIGIALLLLLTTFMKLPDLLNSNIGGICCE